VAEQVKTGTLPELGFIHWNTFPKPWGDIKNVEQLHQDIARADRAVALARRMNIEQFVQESRVIQGYVQSLKALWELKQIVTPEGIADADRGKASACFQMYVDALGQTGQALYAWEATQSQTSRGRPITAQTIRLLDKMIKEMHEVAAECNLPVRERVPLPPVPPERRRR